MVRLVSKFDRTLSPPFFPRGTQPPAVGLWSVALQFNRHAMPCRVQGHPPRPSGSPVSPEEICLPFGDFGFLSIWEHTSEHQASHRRSNRQQSSLRCSPSFQGLSATVKSTCYLGPHTRTALTSFTNSNLHIHSDSRSDEASSGAAHVKVLPPVPGFDPGGWQSSDQPPPPRPRAHVDPRRVQSH